jgi:hypothetical protein
VSDFVKPADGVVGKVLSQAIVLFGGFGPSEADGVPRQVPVVLRDLPPFTSILQPGPDGRQASDERLDEHTNMQ